MNSEDKNFLDRLSKHPHLKERFEALLNVVENTEGHCTTAHDAEQYVIEEIRKMGNAALHDWAGKIVGQAVQQLHANEIDLEGNGKKSPLA